MSNLTALADLFCMAYHASRDIETALRVVLAAEGSRKAGLRLSIALRRPRLPPQRAKVDSCAPTIEEVAQAHGFRPSDLTGRGRSPELRLARYDAYRRLHSQGRSSVVIAAAFGRAHSRIFAGMNQFDELTRQIGQEGTA